MVNEMRGIEVRGSVLMGRNIGGVDGSNLGDGTCDGREMASLQWQNRSRRVCDCVKLGFTGDSGCSRHCTFKDGHSVDDVVFRGESTLCKVRVSELDSVGELLTLYILCDY